jgi:hypothetical protein
MTVQFALESQHRSIKAVLKMLDRQMASVDNDMSGMLKAHFADKLALLKDFKGIGPCTQASLMGALPELGQLSLRKLASWSVSHHCMRTAVTTRANASSGVWSNSCTSRAIHGRLECRPLQPRDQGVSSAPDRQGKAQKSCAGRLHAQNPHDLECHSQIG